jgi:hypothetical protein
MTTIIDSTIYLDKGNNFAQSITNKFLKMMTKKILVGALLILGTAIGVKAFAHSRLSKEEKVKHITEKMAKKLSLSNEQKEKVFLINLDRAIGHEDAYNQGRKKEVIQNAVAKWRTDLKQVLTATQAQNLKI